jgi:hypothetical protein
MEWKYPTLPVKRRLRTQPLVGKVKLALFGCTRDNFGTLSREQHNSKQCPLQWNVLEPVETNHLNQMPRAIIKSDKMLHDNTHLHTAAFTAESLCQLNFVLKHSPHSPDLTPLDYHLFRPLKDTLRGCHFYSDHEVKEVHVWLVTQPETSFSVGIQKLWTAGLSALKMMGTIQKTDAIVHSYQLFSLIKNCRCFLTILVNAVTTDVGSGK